jgi:hypothetical protein
VLLSPFSTCFGGSFVFPTKLSNFHTVFNFVTFRRISGRLYRWASSQLKFQSVISGTFKSILLGNSAANRTSLPIRYMCAHTLDTFSGTGSSNESEQTQFASPDLMSIRLAPR